LEGYVTTIFRVEEEVKHEAGSKICSSEMLVDFQWTTQNYIPEDGILS
jgi:hypothetical protein